jgi:hypothetical protein
VTVSLETGRLQIPESLFSIPARDLSVDSRVESIVCVVSGFYAGPLVVLSRDSTGRRCCPVPFGISLLCVRGSSLW